MPTATNSLELRQPSSAASHLISMHVPCCAQHTSSKTACHMLPARKACGCRQRRLHHRAPHSPSWPCAPPGHSVKSPCLHTAQRERHHRQLQLATCSETQLPWLAGRAARAAVRVAEALPQPGGALRMTAGSGGLPVQHGNRIDKQWAQQGQRLSPANRRVQLGRAAAHTAARLLNGISIQLSDPTARRRAHRTSDRHKAALEERLVQQSHLGASQCDVTSVCEGPAQRSGRRRPPSPQHAGQAFSAGLWRRF